LATYYSSITPEQAALIKHAPLFFVATAAPDFRATSDQVGPVNLSPKGGVPLHVIDDHRVAYLDYAGSGNETAEHLGAGSPITLMVCSFEEDSAAIVRLYGTARVVPIEHSEVAPLLLAHAAQELKLAMRQVIDVTVEKTGTSCGYGVPVMDFVRERGTRDRSRRYK
jgi:Pyridoxamine 5'-phosphate oxidase